MEKKFYTDDFEQLLKEKSDQFRMYPSKRVWHSIYNDLHPGRKWPSVAMSMLLITALLLIGYLNTSDNTVKRQIAANIEDQSSVGTDVHKNSKSRNRSSVKGRDQQLSDQRSESSFEEDIASIAGTGDNSPGINILSNTGIINDLSANTVDKRSTENNSKDILEVIDTYIKTNQIFTDVAAVNKKKKAKAIDPLANSTNNISKGTEEETVAENANGTNKTNDQLTGNDPMVIAPVNSPDPNKTTAAANEKAGAGNKSTSANKSVSSEEKGWIEDYALHNKPARSKWKGRLAMEFYITPAVNYRKLSTETKGSVTPFANADINDAVSHKPGLGIEAGVGFAYAFAKNVRLKAGIQFNETNYGINADETTHPVLSSLLLNDMNTGYSYPVIRSSTLSNPYNNSSALQAVTIHNTTYQVSIPIGLAFKLASNNKLEWFAGASIQPTYVFGGKAYFISADLKDYVSESSLIRKWNLNTGIETYINYKIGGLTLQAGPQARYQLFSTYSKKSVLNEKPYAIGLKIGLVKSF